MMAAFAQTFLMAARCWEWIGIGRRRRSGVRGAFNLVRRQTYEMIRGRASLHMDAADDVKLNSCLNNTYACVPATVQTVACALPVFTYSFLPVLSHSAPRWPRKVALTPGVVCKDANGRHRTRLYDLSDGEEGLGFLSKIRTGERIDNLTYPRLRLARRRLRRRCPPPLIR